MAFEGRHRDGLSQAAIEIIMFMSGPRGCPRMIVSFDSSRRNVADGTTASSKRSQRATSLKYRIIDCTFKKQTS